MDSSLLVLTFYTLFGGFLSLLLAVLQVTGGKRGSANILRFIHFLCNTVILLGNGFIANGIPLEYPFTIFLFPTCCLMLGPSYFFSIKALTGTVTFIKKSYLLHLTPAMLMFIMEIGFQFQDTAIKSDYIERFLTYPLHSSFTPIFFLVVLHIGLYLVLLMKDMLPFWSNREIYKQARIIVIRMFFAIAAVATFTAGIFFSNSLTILIGGSISATIQISILITQDYFPSFFFAIQKEMRKKRYEHSLLQGLNTDTLKRRLEELMGDEEVYKDMDLNLHTLAGKLSISSHQLSQFLNDQLHVSFRNYVNGYRLRAAERLLKESPGLGISAVCYEAGFNSKSRFYALFKEITGKTPQEYRDDIASASKQASQ